MRYLVFLVAILMSSLVAAQNWEDRQVFGTSDMPPLRILSSTDTSFFAPIIEDFIATSPNTSVEYLVAGTVGLDQLFRARPDQFDIVISSAMDLQLKLANDGFSSAVVNVDHPEWAQWHNRLFAFTSEPAAIVLNRQAFNDLLVPSSRQDLIQLMRDHPETVSGAGRDL